MDGLMRKLDRVSESTVEGYLVKRVKEGGGRAVKLQSPADAGKFDRILIYPETPVIFVEVKAPDGKMSPLQEDEWDKLAEAGQPRAVVWCKDDVDRLMVRVATWRCTITDPIVMRRDR